MTADFGRLLPKSSCSFHRKMQPHWTAYVSAFLTPTVAILGAVIAFLQWRIARGKLRLDLFEKRALVHQAARDLLSTILTTGKVTQEDEIKYLSGTLGAK